MANNFLDKTGLSYFWEKIKTWVNEKLANKLDKPSGGTTGQILTKTVNGAEWSNKPVKRVLANIESPISIIFDTPESEIISLLVNGTFVYIIDTDFNCYIPFQNSTNFAIFVSIKNNSFKAIQLSMGQGIYEDLGPFMNPISATVTLTTSGWSSNTQTVTVSGVKAAGQNVRLAHTTKVDADAWAEAGCWCTAQGADSLTFTCETVPTQDIKLNIEMQDVRN